MPRHIDIPIRKVGKWRFAPLLRRVCLEHCILRAKEAFRSSFRLFHRFRVPLPACAPAPHGGRFGRRGTGHQGYGFAYDGRCVCVPRARFVQPRGDSNVVIPPPDTVQYRTTKSRRLRRREKKAPGLVFAHAQLSLSVLLCVCAKQRGPTINAARYDWDTSRYCWTYDEVLRCAT